LATISADSLTPGQLYTGLLAEQQEVGSTENRGAHQIIKEFDIEFLYLRLHFSFNMFNSLIWVSLLSVSEYMFLIKND
jgi:hypothetical protein